jgi:hypothetical protein
MKEERASLWDIPLIDWDAYNGEYYWTVLFDLVSCST